MYWNSFYIIILSCCIFTPSIVSWNYTPKKTLIRNANALRWLRRYELSKPSSTTSSSVYSSSIDRLTLTAFGASLLQILLHTLNENTNDFVQFQPTTSTPAPLEMDQSYMNNMVEMISNASRIRERMAIGKDVCSQRAKCDVERKWRQLTSNVRSIIEKSVRNTTYWDKSIWKLSIRPQKDVCALLYPECPIAKYSSYLISTYLTGASKLR